jgi:hypothetical protein
MKSACFFVIDSYLGAGESKREKQSGAQPKCVAMHPAAKMSKVAKAVPSEAVLQRDFTYAKSALMRPSAGFFLFCTQVNAILGVKS